MERTDPVSSHTSRARRFRLPVVASLLALALVAPRFASAQAVSRADLIGTWALQGSKEYGFIFQDTTVTYRGKYPKGGTIAITGNWKLNGDTLTIGHTIGWLNGKRPVSGRMATRSVALKDNQLTVTRLDNKQAQVFERVDALQTAGNGAGSPNP